MTKQEKAIREFCGHHADWWPSITQVQEMLALAQPEQEPTYTSTQATNCAGCGEHKHTPLRIDAMGGYVCLTCIDKKLGSLLGEFGYEQPEQEPVVGCAECEANDNNHALYCVACAEKFVGEAATKLQQKQETIEGLNRDYDLLFAEYQLLLKKEWVGLTDEERQDIALEVPIDAVFITEAKLKDKNTRGKE